jgi:hypothetical protein
MSPALKPGHPLREIGVAWSLLFGRGVEVLSRDPEVSDARVWPAALGEEPEGPCWDWLGTQASAVAWWPDDEARRELAARGLRVDATDVEALRAVHDKAFTVRHAREHGGLGGNLADLVAVFAPGELRDPSAVLDAIEAWPAWAREQWALKPRFGSTGRGRVHSTEVGDPARFRRALPRLASRGGAILEPWLERVQDFSVQLVVHGDGSVESLGSLHQLVKPGGAVLGGAATLLPGGRSHGAGDDHDAIVSAAVRLVEAAAARGFRGPCGVDSFAWRDRDGGIHLRSLCELNARFTTGHVAIGCALRARESRGGETAFRFLLGGGAGLALAGPAGPSLAPPMDAHGE